MNKGYYFAPHIRSDKLVFSCDDDLWLVDGSNILAVRLTNATGRASHPYFSPSGETIAYQSNDSGVSDIYLIDTYGGEPKRLTHIGIDRLLGFRDANTLLFVSSHLAANRGMGEIYTLDLKSLAIESMNTGPANRIAFGSNKQMLIGRNCRDAARWKRYRGGTAGVFFLDAQGKGNFSQILKNITYNLTDPQILNDQLFFISDHEGVANVYRCSLEGENLERVSNQTEFYARNLNADPATLRLVYHAGGDLFEIDLISGKETKRDVEVRSPAMQAQPRFVNANAKLDSFDIHPEGNRLAIVSRGRFFELSAWKKPPKAYGLKEESRYHHPSYLPDGKQVAVACMKREQDETLSIINLEDGNFYEVGKSSQWGKIWNIIPSPDGEKIAITNNKNELWLTHKSRRGEFRKIVKIDSNSFSRFTGVNWSPDSRYMVYSASVDDGFRSEIRLLDSSKKNSIPKTLLKPILSDWSPRFHPNGKYLFFLSIREFHPNYNQTHFDLGFPFAGRPYVVSLQNALENPFDEVPEKIDKDKKSDNKVMIDYDGINHRIAPVELELGGYFSIEVLEDKLLYWRKSPKPLKPVKNWNKQGDGLYLGQITFEDSKSDIFHKNVSSYSVSHDRQSILINDKNKLRLISLKEIPKNGTENNKKDGWIDLARVQFKIDPKKEWAQMYREAWVLQREHFWTECLSGVDWVTVYKQYLPLLERIKTRWEMSDLLWEMQGELGTSHCYEMFGDYAKKPPHHPIGRLGAKFDWIEPRKELKIIEIFEGDSWIGGADSPLHGIGAGLKPGDCLLAVDGEKLNSALHLYELLESKASTKINLLVRRKGKRKTEEICIQTLSSNKTALYRQWVNANKDYVHKKSDGRLGYVHIPDMGVAGYSEFHRNFLSEIRHEGLVIDVRYNGGGHVSQHIIKTLAQKILAFNLSRYHGESRYPSYAVPGALIAVTNEHAGSDGDIFSHAFKLMKLGPLVGKRTWGGVIGINSQYRLKDGTLTTQPEYSFWFKDVGFAVENYGTDPDVEVDILPQDWASGKDPQIDKAIDIALADLNQNPPIKPDFSKRPDLSRPNIKLLKSKPLEQSNKIKSTSTTEVSS